MTQHYSHSLGIGQLILKFTLYKRGHTWDWPRLILIYMRGNPLYGWFQLTQVHLVELWFFQFIIHIFYESSKNLQEISFDFQITPNFYKKYLPCICFDIYSQLAPYPLKRERILVSSSEGSTILDSQDSLSLREESLS